MTVAFNRHFDNMKYLESLYNKYTNNPDVAFDYPPKKDDMVYVELYNNN